MQPLPQSSSQRGVEFPHVIDIVAHDTPTNSVALIMLESRPWDGSELRLFQLQEKLNAYLAFALDGEMAEAYPSLIGLPLRLQLDCVTPPDSMTVSFLSQVRDQIAFQDIDFIVRVVGPLGCGTDCGCHPPAES
ncbi:MAG: hypothetical protein NTX04_13495 [Verrucomicrobia bacterium]|nr:hypothetical protein [Verrucomicrobiota bacterium]